MNIGSGRETSINQLIAYIEEVVDSQLPGVRNRDKSGGVRRLVADISLARKLLAFKPKISLAGGLLSMFEHDPRFSLESVHTQNP